MSETRKDQREFVHRNQLIFPFGPGRTVSTARAAELLGVCQTTIRDMIDRKEIRGYKMRPKLANSPYRVFRDSLERHVGGVLEEYELENYK